MHVSIYVTVNCFCHVGLPQAEIIASRTVECHANRQWFALCVCVRERDEGKEELAERDVQHVTEKKSQSSPYLVMLNATIAILCQL